MQNIESDGNGKARQPALLDERMAETGIGYAGIEGVWWRPAAKAFHLPLSLAEELRALGRAIFILLDAVQTAYQRSPEGELGSSLRYKVPSGIRAWASVRPALSVRPDFQLEPQADGSYLPVVTELEICPSAHGFAHAMQLGYGLRRDLLEDFLWLLNGRKLVIAATVEWCEFIWEQLAFCRALVQAGGEAKLLYDRPLSEILTSIRHGQLWQPPMFGVSSKPDGWNIDIRGRLTEGDFWPYLWPDWQEWPASVADAVIFRFGYLENFSSVCLDHFQRWTAAKATMINPASFILDSKVCMAALRLNEVRERISNVDDTALAILDRHVPETLLLKGSCLARLMDEQSEWILKFAGFDGDNQAWGGRSLVVGAELTAEAWQAALLSGEQNPWPVIAQRYVPSMQTDIAYLNDQAQKCWLRGGSSRLRAFFLRKARRSEVRISGAHVTLSASSAGVSEGMEAIQAPIYFA